VAAGCVASGRIRPTAGPATAVCSLQEQRPDAGTVEGAESGDDSGSSAEAEAVRICTYSLRCSKGSRLGHDCAYQGVINYYGVFSVCPY
jgi:hypothetical protein